MILRNIFSKQGPDIPLKVYVTSFYKNNKNIFAFIISRLYVLFFCLLVYSILAYFLEDKGWLLFIVAIAMYFVYKEFISDINSIIMGVSK